ncbi:MAG: hypothetical protein ACHQIM_15080 [Sphingobacteriales bacterium]
MIKKSPIYLLILICSMLIAGCSNNEKPAGTAATPQKTALMEPFRYHKMIEVSPGQDYDILSWGRGSKTVGAFMILHSDSAAAKYTTTTGDLDGAIVDVYNSDMDLDGNPEILIQTKGKDTTNYTTMYAFEFTNGKAQKLDFPRLTQSQRQGYRGDDDFYIKDGMLFREFPIYDGSGKAAKPSGQKRQLQYGLRNNSFTVKQLSKDSTRVSTVTPVAIQPVKKKTTERKHEVVKKHKKKHRRHHTDDEG